MKLDEFVFEEFNLKKVACFKWILCGLKQEHAREAYRACRVECLAAAESWAELRQLTQLRSSMFSSCYTLLNSVTSLLWLWEVKILRVWNLKIRITAIWILNAWLIEVCHLEPNMRSCKYGDLVSSTCLEVWLLHFYFCSFQNGVDCRRYGGSESRFIHSSHIQVKPVTIQALLEVRV